jgi:ABC-type amino acid transport substrate-binding protein
MYHYIRNKKSKIVDWSTSIGFWGGIMKKRIIISLTLISILAATISGCGVFGDKMDIIVATDPHWAPFESVDAKTQKIVGYDIDLMDAIAAKYGLKVTYVQVPLDPMMAGVQKCQYDAAISSITPNPETYKDISYSDSYFTTGQQITSLASNMKIKSQADLSGKKIGALIATTGADEAKKIQGATVTPFITIDAAFQDLLSGRIDAVIVDNVLALKYFGQNPGKFVAFGDLLHKQDIAIAVCQKESGLLGKVNAAIAQFKTDGYFHRLSDKWFFSINP